ncbi:hypothetical protein EPA93_25580 [Ktedonosporobacter rubrisoli]|uniref:Uncharacterized protein n=1 Tax=Ktedonosporobacter rubrisoli TaxID=2509675 RepID=A0A4P6JW08_KTERU|nr:hypothetical protein [Ktedonosporobacter rubrisoli]QBD79166.1 hypothetical protein EPA93_25580 [Ktedonosporobacter rubrisoli]
MHNDSLETLLLRHYGGSAATPPELEQRLVASVRREAAEVRKQQRIATRLRTYPVSRRRVMRLVAMGSVGVGILSAGMEGLRTLEDALVGQDITQRPALS